MGYEPCRKCGACRKHGPYSIEHSGVDWDNVPPCQHCGDEEYFEDDQGNQRPSEELRDGMVS